MFNISPLWFKYGDFSFFFPSEYGEFQKLSSKINLLYKMQFVFLVPNIVKFHQQKTCNLE
jgi:hypothetical protein